MDNTELAAIQPAEYLKNGFYDQQGEPLEGLNGYYSLATAYRLREEKADPDRVQDVVDQLDSMIASQDKSIDQNPKLSLDADSLRALDEIAKKTSSSTLRDVFTAARPWVKDWRTFAALTVHLHRVLSQFSLIHSLPEKE